MSKKNNLLTNILRIKILIKLLYDDNITLEAKAVAAMILLLPYKEIFCRDQIFELNTNRATRIRNALVLLKKHNLIKNEGVKIFQSQSDTEVNLMYTIEYEKKSYIISPITNNEGYLQRKKTKRKTNQVISFK